MVRPCISRTTSEHFQSKRLGLECVPKHKEHTSSKISRRIFIPSCDRKKKKIKSEIQIGLEIRNSNLSALVHTAAMVYIVVCTVVYTAAPMVYTVVYTAAAAGIYRGIYCGIYWYIGIYRSYIPVFTRAAIIPFFPGAGLQTSYMGLRGWRLVFR